MEWLKIVSYGSKNARKMGMISNLTQDIVIENSISTRKKLFMI